MFYSRRANVTDIPPPVDFSQPEPDPLHVQLAKQIISTVPVSLGNATGIKVINNRVICETESGIPMIVPQRHFP